MKINAVTAVAVGAALGSVVTVMLSGKKISGKKISREMKDMACGMTAMLPSVQCKNRP
jgi:hypothetical protein